LRTWSFSEYQRITRRGSNNSGIGKNFRWPNAPNGVFIVPSTRFPNAHVRQDMVSMDQRTGSMSSNNASGDGCVASVYVGSEDFRIDVASKGFVLRFRLITSTVLCAYSGSVSLTTLAYDCGSLIDTDFSKRDHCLLMLQCVRAVGGVILPPSSPLPSQLRRSDHVNASDIMRMLTKDDMSTAQHVVDTKSQHTDRSAKHFVKLYGALDMSRGISRLLKNDGSRRSAILEYSTCCLMLSCSFFDISSIRPAVST
jgi:hypothetical protein